LEPNLIWVWSTIYQDLQWCYLLFFHVCICLEYMFENILQCSWNTDSVLVLYTYSKLIFQKHVIFTHRTWWLICRIFITDTIYQGCQYSTKLYCCCYLECFFLAERGIQEGCTDMLLIMLNRFGHHILTLILLTWSIGWAPNNASRWQMGFNSMFKGLI
jgi:hypothetical protein